MVETDEVHLEIKGLETFRKVCLVTSLICTCVSILVVGLDPLTCPGVDLTAGVYTVLGVQASVFLLLLMHYIHCGCLLRKLRIVLAVYYFALVGAMFWAQICFFRGNGCGSQAFVLYYWLAANVAIFYVFVAYGLSLWGAYLCWAQEEEETVMAEALKFKMAQMVDEKASEMLAAQNQPMIAAV